MITKIADSQKGTTLTEMLVVIAIVGLLSVIVVPNYKSGGSQMALQRSANRLSQDIRRAEEMAVSAKECQGCGQGGTTGVPDGYGINITKGDNFYILYADDGNEKYSGGDIIIEQLNFEKGVYIQEITTSNNNQASINFRPPDPIINLDIVPAGPKRNYVTIDLALDSDSTKIKTIYVNEAGLIYVQ